MKQNILEILKAGGGYVSGEKISQKLGISRAAVWKHIKALRAEGYEIESATNRGYRLSSEPDLITAGQITAGLKTTRMGQNVIYVYSTDSTNEEAKRRCDEPDGTLFTADIQTGGKGRLGRAWTSPGGGGIWMSLLLKPDIPPSRSSGLTLAAGLAVYRALKDFGVMIKWPNDIVADGKKICGILTEMSAEMERVNYIVCGIGINVNAAGFPPEIGGKAVSLRMMTGKNYERAPVIRRVMEEFEPLYGEFLKNGLKNIIPEYEAACVNISRGVNAVLDGKTVSGTAAGIGQDGSLLIDTPNGRVTVSSGEISVRGIYGYV